MTGTLALEGGAPFTGHDDLDGRLLAAAGATSVVVLPTADAFEDPTRLVAAAEAWGQRLGVSVTPLMVLRRTDALDTSAASQVRSARAVWLVGDSSLHLRSVLKDTPVYEALAQVLTDGGVIVGVGASGAALCDPMTDPRGGAFTLGLGLVPGMAVVTEAETWSADRLARTDKLADVPLLTLTSTAAAVRRDGAWELIGDATVSADLPV
jgi:cyanophycinase